MTLSVALTCASALLWLALMVRIGLVAARMYQLEEYDGRRLLRWMRTTPGWLMHRASLGIITGGGTVIIGIALILVDGVAAGWMVAGLFGHIMWFWPDAKKPLVVTPRLRRLLATAGVLGPVFAAAVGLDARLDPLALGVLFAVAGMMVIPALILILANLVLWPYELHIRRGFRRRAAAKLGSRPRNVVAIAGSYGKTTTKRLVAQALDVSGDTWPTPKSFNTLMGLTRTINDDLRESHDNFIAEMDAYSPGENAAMCRLVKPSISVICSVGPQHMERFGNLERIADALYEVVDGLPQTGTAIIYGDDEHCAQLAERARASGRRVVTYGSDADALDIIARDIQVRGDGTSFTVDWPGEAVRLTVDLPLLGRHQALNASAAIAVARILGRDLGEVVGALRTTQPVEHRLQPMATSNGIQVIDDSYNANPVGVHNALEVLAEIDATTRIVVTPGIVELGDVEDAENERYGEHAADVCDDVIVVRARTTAALVRGLTRGGIAKDRVHVVDNLDAATATIGTIAVPGSVVLFANDLPDTY